MTGAVPYRSVGISRSGLAGVAVAHLIAVLALSQMQVGSLPAPLAVLSASLLPREAPRQAEIVPPRPKPVARQALPPAVPAPRIAALRDAPATTPVAVPPAPTLAAPPPVVAAPPAPPQPASPPRFDADYLDNPKPVYPAISRRLREEGTVIVRVRVGADGMPLEVQLHAGSGFVRLDNAALTTVQHWKFVPARLGDAAVSANVLVPIVFSLKD